MSETPELHDTLRYLASPEARRSLEAHTYYPKWHSPWWHLTLLHEMGIASQAPKETVALLVQEMKRTRIPFFVLREADVPPGYDHFRGSCCHCELGNIYQALTTCGVEVDRELPWIRPWFLRYQLADGGLNCDYDVYLLENPPGSIVGTLPPLEAMLYSAPKPWSAAEIAFLDRGASFLIHRKLMFAGWDPRNAEEKEDEADWLKPCFPRFYFYDVLRGLHWLLNYAKLRESPIPRAAIEPAFRSLDSRFGSGPVVIERTCYEGVRSASQDADGKRRRDPASFFPLLESLSRVGEPSPYLTAQWRECRQLVEELGRKGVIV
jgi:hypothetical protein